MILAEIGIHKHGSNRASMIIGVEWLGGPLITDGIIRVEEMSGRKDPNIRSDQDFRGLISAYRKLRIQKKYTWMKGNSQRSLIFTEYFLNFERGEYL
jgi:hypothetical protein